MPQAGLQQKDQLFYTVTNSNQLMKFDVNTGESAVLELNGDENGTYTWPRFIADTNAILVSSGTRGSFDAELTLLTGREKRANRCSSWVQG